MERLYAVKGTLDRDFVGQITYTISLERVYHRLDIALSLDPAQRTWSEEEITGDVLEGAAKAFWDDTGIRLEGEALARAVRGMKTEIHLLATLNDRFIGCIHRQLDERHMRFDGEDATPGCIPQGEFGGVLKVTVLVFNVLKDDTRYALSVWAE